MMSSLDCLIIGHNDMPFPEFERVIRAFGQDSEAYRDLKLSFVTLGDDKLTYVDLLNRVHSLAHCGGQPLDNEFCSGDMPHLAAAYLCNFLQRRGFAATYISLFQKERARLAELLDRNPICVAITTTLYVLNLPAIEVVQFIRERNPRTKIVIGGPLIANHARNYLEHGNAGQSVQIGQSPHLEFESALRDIGADIYVIEGQGELTLARVIDALKSGKDLRDVANVAFFDSGEFCITASLPEENSLDENYIDWSAVSTDTLGPTVQTRTARSCAFKCSFCNYPTRAGKLSLSSVATVERELDSIAAAGGVTNVVFVDDTFNVPIERFKDICRMIIRKNFGFNWFSYFRCSNSDAEAFGLMRDSGCKGVFLGIESGSPDILKNMNKAATVEKYTEGIQKLREMGILTFASFIIGFPGETAATISQTERFIRENRPDFYRTQLWYCEPGTPIQRQRSVFGIQGEGFNWLHNTMESLEAMEHIERIFFTINESIWLPQWSFDFWILPALLGRGLSLEQIRQFVQHANKLLRIELATMPPHQKVLSREQWLSEAAAVALSWSGRQKAVAVH
jgi:radical SAM PhpK family P-methyltransferase